jgi:DnaK suppressor protein
VTSTVHDQFEPLRSTLEAQFQQHTEQLTELTVCGQQPDRCRYDAETLAGLTASTRQALADTAHALRRMADGTYGICEGCGGKIPTRRLEILPHARFCVPCQRRRTG